MINNDERDGMTGRRMLMFFVIGVLMWLGLVALGMWIIR